jgi:hypothetical protein
MFLFGGMNAQKIKKKNAQLQMFPAQEQGRGEAD